MLARIVWGIRLFFGGMLGLSIIIWSTTCEFKFQMVIASFLTGVLRLASMIRGGDDDLVFADSDDDTLLPLQQLQKFSHFLQAWHGYTWPPSSSPSPSPSSPPSPPIFIKIFHFPLVQARYASFLWISVVVFLYFSENLCLETAGECSDIRRCPKGAVLPLYLYHGHALLLVSKYQYLCPNIAPARQWIIDGALGAIEMYIGRSHPGHTALTWMLHLV